MAPKKQQPSKAESKSKAADAIDDDPLQAVVLADSYNRRFEVLCTDQPRILLPLCSTPLLTWTLESLSLSKVKQVFLFCGAHADKIRDFVASSPYRFTLDIQCLSSQTARTAGDALRDLDAMQVLDPENPFILVHSPLISNYDVSKMVEAHKKRRDGDKNYIMTMGVGKGGRPHPESPIMVVHPPSGRLLHYTQRPFAPRQKHMTIPSSLFLDPPLGLDTWSIWSGTHPHANTSVGGFRDLGIDICEADVLALCTENFDYHDMRRHFVNGVLTSELLGKKIAVHLVGTGEEEEAKGDSRSGKGGRYVERIRDTRTYGEVTRDVLRRWAFPLVPDPSEAGGTGYDLRKGNVYVAKDNVVLSRTTVLSGPLLIGPRSALAQGTSMRQSTLGGDCSIGPHSTLSRAHVFDDVRVGANCVLEECIVGRGVEIGDNVKITRGCLIGDGVKLGKGVILPEFARVGRERFQSGDEDSDGEADDDEEDEARHAAILGEESIAFLWPVEEEELPDESDADDQGEDPYEHPRNKMLTQLGRRLSNISDSTESVSTLSAASSSASSSPASVASSASLPDMPALILDTGPPPAFHAEASASLARAYEEGHSVENALLELRTLVMGYNAGLDRAREEVTGFLMSRIDVSGPAPRVLKSAHSIFARWGPLALNLSPDAANIALDVQAYCVEHITHSQYFGIVLRGLYEADVVGEEDLVEWRSLSTAKGEGTATDEEKKKWLEAWARGKAYVDVLERMESESEGEEEDEEDG